MSLNYILKELSRHRGSIKEAVYVLWQQLICTLLLWSDMHWQNVFLFFSMCLIIASFLVFKNPSLLNSVILGGLISFIHLLHQRRLQ